ncbi:hypothetical protein BC939DRAFT_465759 [Gamsiella multidivaricata]|uniref:uncharacterized protein n=1 Tax=Gamsiella multidivaricata TaxID=101098 RepID=UPI0022211C91|nr:uncharacterized protein BC939DRAFT_465759 [Gamsiella multidivaricata]KAI7817481.1 hypothetical protein BC939DRAFT_465759 [Gamsiella multidivaricata]
MDKGTVKGFNIATANINSRAVIYYCWLSLALLFIRTSGQSDQKEIYTRIDNGVFLSFLPSFILLFPVPHVMISTEHSRTEGERNKIKNLHG